MFLYHSCQVHLNVFVHLLLKAYHPECCVYSQYAAANAGQFYCAFGGHTTVFFHIKLTID